MERKGERYDIQKESDEIITNYVIGELEKWQEKAIKHNTGSKEVCNCLSCMKETANEFNTALVLFLGRLEREEAFRVYEEWHFEVAFDQQGVPFIGTGNKEWGQRYDEDSDTGMETR